MCGGGGADASIEGEGVKDHMGCYHGYRKSSGISFLRSTGRSRQVGKSHIAGSQKEKMAKLRSKRPNYCK